MTDLYMDIYPVWSLLFCFRKLRPKSVVDVDGSDYCPGILSKHHPLTIEATKYINVKLDPIYVRTIQCSFVEKKGRIWSSLIGGKVLALLRGC